MMLVESIPKEPLCFQLIRFDNQKVSYTIQVTYESLLKLRELNCIIFLTTIIFLCLFFSILYIFILFFNIKIY